MVKRKMKRERVREKGGEETGFRKVGDDTDFSFDAVKTRILVCVN